MKYRHKLLLDRVLARPAAFLLNCLVRPLGLLLHRSHNDEPGAVKTIVIVKIVGLGSIVATTPHPENQPHCTAQQPRSQRRIVADHRQSAGHPSQH